MRAMVGTILLLSSLSFGVLAIEILPAREQEPRSNFITGHKLLDDYIAHQKVINSQDIKHSGFFRSGTYAGYVAGVYDSTVDFLFCPPNTTTLGQAQDIVGKYLRENPARLHFSGARLAVEALSLAYPCDPKGN